MEKSASLSYRDLSGVDRSLKLDAQTYRIGRLEDNDLSFDNPYISRFHAEIIYDGSCYKIHDLESTSGTFVNGKRVRRRLLRDGDHIRLGRGRGVEFVFSENLAGDTADDDEDADALRPVRVIPPDETRFINTARLPSSGDLTNKTVERLRALYEFTSEILAAHSARELSEKLATFMHRTLRAGRCAVMMSDRERGTLDITASCPAEHPVSPSRSVTMRVFNENVALLSVDTRTDERFSARDSIRLQSISSIMCAPIGSKTRLWGVCYVDNLSSKKPFDDEALDFLTAVARQAGLAMENLYLLDEQRRSLESFIRTLAASLDARDDNTAGHSARVGAYSAGIARLMGLSEASCRLTYYAGLLHDYGKIGIRDDVLLKPAELTPEEYEYIKEHPIHTFRLLSKIRFPEDLADIPFVAAAHHERWDGTGYPHGLKGDEIPIGSRIVAVADAYDALTEERVYHEPWRPEKALVELTMRSGTYFDPQVIEAFVEYFSCEIEPHHKRRNRARQPAK